MYLRRLQSRVTTMQQRNNMLKSERKITDGENYNEHGDDVQLSEGASLEGSAVKFKQCEDDCEVPSQSNIINAEHGTETLSNCKTIVSLAPDSTNE